MKILRLCIASAGFYVIARICGEGLLMLIHGSAVGAGVVAGLAIGRFQWDYIDSLSEEKEKP